MEKEHSTDSEQVAVGQQRFSSEVLLAGEPMVLIEHQGSEYRLQVTRSGKLILTNRMPIPSPPSWRWNSKDSPTQEE